MNMGLSQKGVRRPTSLAEDRRRADRSSYMIQVLLRRQSSNCERIYQSTPLCQDQQEDPITIYDKDNHFL